MGKSLKFCYAKVTHRDPFRTLIHHLMIEDYLEDALRKLADAQQNHPGDLEPGSPYLVDLLPDRWALAHPRSVRKERVEDREKIFDTKRWRRAKARVQAGATKAATAR
jgi:hypothetical protein